MSDYDNLIQRLISEANDTKYMLGHASSLHTAAADAINELVAERCYWQDDAQQRAVNTDYWRVRATKAEVERDDALTRMEGLVNNLSFRISEAKDWKERAEKAEVDAIEAEAALWRVLPGNHTIGNPDPMEGPGETYHAAYGRVCADLAAARAALRIMRERAEKADEFLEAEGHGEGGRVRECLADALAAARAEGGKND